MAYTASKSIKIDHTKVGASDSVNFPFLFSGSYAYLATVANAGDVTSASGYDIIFTSDAAGTTLLNWEIESYNPVTGTVNIWVKVPTVSHTVDTVIYVFYGNAAVVTFQGGAVGSVWDANFGAVYHFDSARGLAADSTVNANNGADVNVIATPGQIDSAGSFDGSTSYIQLPAALVFLSTSKTISFWANPVSVATYSAIFANTNANYYLAFNAAGDLFFSYVDGSSVQQAQAIASGIASVGSWAYYTLDCAVSGSNVTLTAYKNGVLAGTISSAGGYQTPVVDTFFIGAFDVVPNFPFHGVLDELRISNIARSADWILAEYNNQSSPSTFYTLTPPAPSPISISPTNDGQGFTGNVTVTGTNFSTGTLSFSGAGITVNSYSVQNSTTITANITIGGGAALGARDVIVTNADTQTGTLAAAFTVGFTISGSVGVAGAGATITLSGAGSATTTADASGNYSFTGLAAGTYLVTASRTGLAFSPTNQTVVITAANVSGVNFTTFKPRRWTSIIGTNLGTKIIR